MHKTGPRISFETPPEPPSFENIKKNCLIGELKVIARDLGFAANDYALCKKDYFLFLNLRRIERMFEHALRCSKDLQNEAQCKELEAAAEAFSPIAEGEFPKILDTLSSETIKDIQAQVCKIIAPTS
jgi:hypothetical protein